MRSDLCSGPARSPWPSWGETAQWGEAVAWYARTAWPPPSHPSLPLLSARSFRIYPFLKNLAQSLAHCASTFTSERYHAVVVLLVFPEDCCICSCLCACVCAWCPLCSSRRSLCNVTLPRVWNPRASHAVVSRNESVESGDVIESNQSINQHWLVSICRFEKKDYEALYFLSLSELSLSGYKYISNTV